MSTTQSFSDSSMAQQFWSELHIFVHHHHKSNNGLTKITG